MNPLRKYRQRQNWKPRLKPLPRISVKLLAKPGKSVRRVSAKQRKRNAAMKKLTIQRWEEGPRLCMLTDPPHYISNFEDFVLDHRKPGQMGGGKDDSPENLQDACWFHNLLKGSRRDWDAKQARFL